KSSRHDGKLRALQRCDLFALHDVLLPGGVENLNCGLRLRFQPPRERLAAFCRRSPHAVVRFNRAVWVENLREHLGPVARADAGEVGADLSTFPTDRMANRALSREHFLAAGGISAFF